MPAKIYSQLNSESNTWKEILEFIMNENVQMKNKLAEILKNNFERNSLNGLEKFQTKIIKEDDRIGLLRNEIVEIKKLIGEEDFENEKYFDEIMKKVDVLRSNLINAGNQSSKLKSEFNKILFENQ